MQLIIEEGRWIVSSRDEWLRIVIQPRRSLDGSATRMTVRAEPMPLLEMKPETFVDGTPTEAWIWNGTKEGATAIARRICHDLRIHLAPRDDHAPAVLAWRRKMVAALGGTADAGESAAPQVQRA